MPAHYGQYMFNGLAINPAYAGSREVLTVTALFRKQWLGLPGSPTTLTVAAHGTSKNKKNNLGLLLVNDRIGAQVQDHLQAMYAYRFDFLKGKLAFGLQGGISLLRTNYGDLYLEDHFSERRYCHYL